MAAPRSRSPDATPRRLRRSSAPASSRWMVSDTARPAPLLGLATEQALAGRRDSLALKVKAGAHDDAGKTVGQQTKIRLARTRERGGTVEDGSARRDSRSCDAARIRYS